jgi:threonine aldolase
VTRRVELRSDTFTRPSPAMRRAMAEAEVGDDVWNEDPTVARLEALAAELTGKEAAVFVSSGTQGNLVGLLSHTQPGQEVILGDQSHIFWYEVAGAAVVGGLQFRTLPNGDGRLGPDGVRSAIRGVDIHFPRTGAVALENTHNRCGGTVLDPGYIQEIVAIAHEAGVPVHLDGARVFNAAAAQGVPVAELTAPVDSVTFCLSKGLGAPVGSLLCGSSDYIARARHWRKLLGGGMRQVGVLAAAGLVALEQNVERLAEDHANARVLAEGLAQIPGIDLDLSRVQSNIVYFDIGGIDMPPEQFLGSLAERGVFVSAGGKSLRAVTSYEVNRGDIDYALSTMNEVARASTPAVV